MRFSWNFNSADFRRMSISVWIWIAQRACRLQGDFMRQVRNGAELSARCCPDRLNIQRLLLLIQHRLQVSKRIVVQPLYPTTEPEEKFSVTWEERLTLKAITGNYPRLKTYPVACASLTYQQHGVRNMIIYRFALNSMLNVVPHAINRPENRVSSQINPASPVGNRFTAGAELGQEDQIVRDDHFACIIRCIPHRGFGNHAGSDPFWLLQSELAAQCRDRPGSGKDNVRMFNRM
ncbi:hypothetical protein EVAR_101265_1 [Eumeta japonica]|uniref:Uncharacterized protein n=1 Tax=Eumeta variegata TaxID=151549 RepID=A0A4C1SNM8_EUMVA|nr:hypothetical protein EVAR_101265_1 [Eumeta japonica]